MSVTRPVLIMRAPPASRCAVMRSTPRSQAFLEAMRPAQLEVSMAAFDQVAARARQLDRQWALTLERARYEAELARRRFVAVDPENRLVARTLEREWNEKLAEIERLERDATLRPPLANRLVDPEERRRVLALAHDLSKVWHAATTLQTDRKQLLIYLIKDVTLCRGETTIQVAIRWQTEACTVLEVPRPKLTYEVRRTDPVVVARVRPWRRNTPTARSPPCWTRRVSDQAPRARSRRIRCSGFDMHTRSPVAVPRGRPHVKMTIGEMDAVRPGSRRSNST